MYGFSHGDGVGVTSDGDDENAVADGSFGGAGDAIGGSFDGDGEDAADGSLGGAEDAIGGSFDGDGGDAAAGGSLGGAEDSIGGSLDDGKTAELIWGSPGSGIFSSVLGSSAAAGKEEKKIAKQTISTTRMKAMLLNLTFNSFPPYKK